MTTDKKETRAEFDDVVNMTARELRRWLDTDESATRTAISNNGPPGRSRTVSGDTR